MSAGLARWRGAWAQFQPGARRFLIGSAWLGAARAVPQTLLALYLDRLGLDKQGVGQVLSAEAWGQVLVAIPAALLLARLRTPPLLALSAALAGIGYMALPWLPAQGLRIGCNVVNGLAWWLHMLAVAPFLFRHSSERERPLLFALAEAVHTLAAVLGAFLFGWAVDWAAPRLAGGERQALAIALSSAGALCCMAVPIYASIRDERAPGGPALRLFALVRAHRVQVFRFALPRFLLGCGAGLCIPFLGLYFQDRFGLSPGAVASLQSTSQLLMSTGYLLSPFLLKRLGYVRTIAGLELVSIPFFLVLAFATRVEIAVLAFLLRAALMNAAHPVQKNFLMLNAPEGLREAQNAIEAMAWGSAWWVGPQLGGWILVANKDNYAVLMCVTVGFYVLAIASTFLLLARYDPWLHPEQSPKRPAEPLYADPEDERGA